MEADDEKKSPGNQFAQGVHDALTFKSARDKASSWLTGPKKPAPSPAPAPQGAPGDRERQLGFTDDRNSPPQPTPTVKQRPGQRIIAPGKGKQK